MKPDSNLIFDIGMHIGQDTEYYLKKGFRVVAVEANPYLVQAAHEKFPEEIANGSLTVLNVALGADSGEATFYVNPKVSEWSSLDKRLGSRQAEAEEISVKTKSYEAIAEEFGTPYYMKIDIEGADEIPITGLGRVKNRPAHVSYEASSLAGSAMLYTLGYRHFKLVGQRNLPDYKLPFPAKEGEYVDHTFVPGSSGPFGDETDGPWSNYDEAVTDYVVFMHFRRLDKRLKQDWCDIHAKSDRFLKTFL